ncbi:hypothetical protein ILUMI_24397 [Ignelater luminosus]|uniref:PiggyBac transposable element-derived protein domain-containing protein n=1 Tax=Ignelater luminosus TaxID=2038154 RepID=A0A8K0CCM8_IGNLU|nr:hypothetical protein ILUMI_24397 [Ignelater luminosus]
MTINEGKLIVKRVRPQASYYPKYTDLQELHKFTMRQSQDVNVVYIPPKVDKMSYNEYIDDKNIDGNAPLNLDIGDTVKIKYSVAEPHEPEVLEASMKVEVEAEKAWSNDLKLCMSTELPTGKADNLSYPNSRTETFLGILSGYHSLLQWKIYWPNLPDFGIPIVKQSIKQCFHLVNNEELDCNDKFTKLRPFINACNKRFIKFGIFSHNLFIEEQVISYLARHSCKIFIRRKPI